MRRLFSNTKSAQNLPNLGKESESISYLIDQTDVPYENEERIGVEIMINLCSWEWGCKALFSN